MPLKVRMLTNSSPIKSSPSKKLSSRNSIKSPTKSVLSSPIKKPFSTSRSTSPTTKMSTSLDMKKKKKKMSTSDILGLDSVERRRHHSPEAVERRRRHSPEAVESRHRRHSPEAVERRRHSPEAVERRRRHSPEAVERRRRHSPEAVERRRRHSPEAVERRRRHSPEAVERRRYSSPVEDYESLDEVESNDKKKRMHSLSPIRSQKLGTVIPMRREFSPLIRPFGTGSNDRVQLNTNSVRLFEAELDAGKKMVKKAGKNTVVAKKNSPRNKMMGNNSSINGLDKKKRSPPKMKEAPASKESSGALQKLWSFLTL